MSGTSHIAHAFRHAAIYSGANVLGKIISFLMLPIYAHYIRGEGYGIIGMIDVLLSVATMMIGYGITGAMWRFYFENEDEDERKKFVSSTIILMFILVVIVTMPFLLFNEFMAKLAFGKDGLGYYLLIATLSFIFEMTSRSAEAYILIRQKPFLISIISLARLVLGLSLNIYLIVYLEMGVLGFLYTSLICSGIATVVTHGYSLAAVGLHFQTKFARKILGYSLPLIPGQIANFVRGNADRMILRAYLGLSQLGAFEMLFKFASLIGILIVEPFHKIWGVKRFEICDHPEGPETIAKMVTFQIAIILFAVLVLSVEVPLLLRILTPEEFWVSEWIVFIAMVSRIFNPMYQQLNFGLQYAKNTSKISVIEIITAVVNVMFNFVLIYNFQLLGAVISSVIGGAVQCAMAYHMAKGYYPLAFEWRKIIGMFFSVIILFLIINAFSVSKIGAYEKIDQFVTPVVKSAIEFASLDKVKNGKLLYYATKNVPLVVEAQIKLILSLLLLPVLLSLNVISRDNIVQVIPFLRNRYRTDGAG